MTRVATKTASTKALRRRVVELEDENAQLREANAEINDRFLNLSQRLVERDFGKERVEAAFAAATYPGSTADISWMLRQEHPYFALVYWHRHAAMH